MNDCLLLGPKQQPELFQILLRLRFFQYALTGDVNKTYRQLELNVKDRNFHQLYWRSKPSDPIEKSRLTRVIYGVTSSSYHSIRALRDAAERSPNQLCRDSILESFYVDDLVGGANTEQEAIALYRDITVTLGTIGMGIRKWASNSKRVLEAFPSEYREKKKISFAEQDKNIRTLGLLWAPEPDCFRFKFDSRIDAPALDQPPEPIT